MHMMLSEEAPGVFKAISDLDERSLDIEERLREHVKIQASQINGCAFCIDMHTKNAYALGEDEQRIYALSAWRVIPSPHPKTVRRWS